jgi:hypothetical protein
MAVLAINEYDSDPASAAQWEQYYNYVNDTVYQQVLPASTWTQKNISTITRLDGLVTVVTTAGHGISVGDGVTLAGVTDSTYDGDFIVTSVPTTSSFTFVQTGLDGASTAGTVDPTYPLWESRGTMAAVRDSIRGDDTLTRSKYLGRDYGTFLDEGLAWMRENYGDKFNDFVASDFGMMYAKYVSAAFDTLSWYMDREVSEWFYALLRLRSRIEELARMSAYKPRPATACTVDEDMTLDEGPYAFTFTMPKGTRWQGPGTLLFETAQDIIWAAGEVSKTAQPLIQGETISESFVANGEAHFQIELTSVPDGKFVAQDSVEVYVDGVEWDVVDFLPYDRLNQIEIVYGSDPPYGTFGDGVVGNIPVEGAAIIVKYIATQGTLGKAATRGTITALVDPLVVNNEVIPVTGDNPSTASGGEAIESLEEIRANAPAYFKTADRGVTKQDLTTLADIYSSGVYGTVAKAKANIVRGIADDLALQTLLANIDGHQADLEGYLDTINTDADTIDAAVAAIAVARGTVSTKGTDIDTEVASIKANVVTGKGSLESATGALDKVPYEEVVAQGDGSTSVWTGVQLEKFPIAPGTVVFWSDNFTVDHTGAAGDCDTTVGVLTVSGTPFLATDVGRSILIGSQLRQVTAFVSTNELRYSGEAIAGTGLLWELYQPQVSAIDDGNGGFTGTGINAGSCSISYSTGQLDVALSFPLEGGVDYGRNLLVQYGYEEQAARSFITTADGFFDDIDTDADDIDSLTDDIDTALTDIATEEGNITTATTDIRAQTALALTIPAAIEAEVDALELYLDEHLSGECKANIVIVQCLVTDEDGFYAAPTQVLLTAVKTDLEDHNVVPTTISTVSGYYNMVAVNMTVELKIADQYLYNTVKALVETAIDTLLKGRDYDEDLFRSDYYNIVVPNQDGVGGITGVSYANITITSTTFPDPANTGTAPSVDSNGNLLVNEDQIITKGTITYSEITS